MKLYGHLNHIFRPGKDSTVTSTLSILFNQAENALDKLVTYCNDLEQEKTELQNELDSMEARKDEEIEKLKSKIDDLNDLNELDDLKNECLGLDGNTRYGNTR